MTLAVAVAITGCTFHVRDVNTGGPFPCTSDADCVSPYVCGPGPDRVCVQPGGDADDHQADGWVDGDHDNPPGESGPDNAPTECDDGTLPGAPTLETPTFGMKAINLSWSAGAGGPVKSYNVMMKVAGGAFEPQGEALESSAASTGVEVAVHRVDWLNTSYRIDACNSCGCVSSNEESVESGMLPSIGYFKASNTESGDVFGEALAISADGKTLAVGAYGEQSGLSGVDLTIDEQRDNSAPHAGAVYVFVRDEQAGWRPQAYLKASNANEGDDFGWTLAISGDGSTLAVGAYYEGSGATGVNPTSPLTQTDNSLVHAGAVYVFSRNGTTWSQQAYVKASNTEAQDLFGCALAISNSGDTLAVGACDEDSAGKNVDPPQVDGQLNNSAANAGAVYMFSRNGITWSQKAYVKASNTGSGDLFGKALAISGDGNTLAVGAPGEASDAEGVDLDQQNELKANAGAVYVFSYNGATWSQQAYVKASNTDSNDYFGSALAISYNGNTLAVGAYGEDSNAQGSSPQTNNSTETAGAVYVFLRNGPTWSQQAYVKASNTEAVDYFGWALAMSGDGNTLAVGAYGEDSSAQGVTPTSSDNSTETAGAVYVFLRNGTAWSQQAYVKASNTDPTNSDLVEGDHFGFALDMSADGNTLAVGAYNEDSAGKGVSPTSPGQADNTALHAGAVYLY